MVRFNLKSLFCLTLVVGVALMWGAWARGTDKTANRLLELRENLRTIPKEVFFDDYLEEIGILSPHPYNFCGMSSAVNSEGKFMLSPVTLWLDCTVGVEFDWSAPAPPHSRRICWKADWSTIEATAKEENQILYRNIVVTVFASLMLVWVLPGQWGLGKLL